MALRKVTAMHCLTFFPSLGSAHASLGTSAGERPSCIIRANSKRNAPSPRAVRLAALGDSQRLKVAAAELTPA